MNFFYFCQNVINQRMAKFFIDLTLLKKISSRLSAADKALVIQEKYPDMVPYTPMSCQHLKVYTMM